MVTTVEIADSLSLRFRAIPGSDDNVVYRIAVGWQAPFDELAFELIDEAIDDVVDSTDDLKHGEEYRVYFLKEQRPAPHEFAAEAAEAIVARTDELYPSYRQRFDSSEFDKEMGDRGF